MFSSLAALQKHAYDDEQNLHTPSNTVETTPSSWRIALTRIPWVLLVVVGMLLKRCKA